MLEMMKESMEDLMTPNLWLALPAEMLGTLVITLIGCGAWHGSTDHPNEVRVALAFGLAVATVVWVFNHTSGSHVNPAVTLAALFTRRVSIIRGVLYIVSQVVGGIVGAGLIYWLAPEGHNKNLGSTYLGEDVTAAQGFGIEFIITFLYVITYFASHDDKRTDLKGSAPLTLGLAVVACHVFALDLTGAGMNPARSFGPAVVADFWEHHWVFWVGPLAGGAVAGLVYEYIFAAGATFAGARKCLLRVKKPRKQPVAEEAAPLEEVKADGVETEETKIDAEGIPEVVVVEAGEKKEDEKAEEAKTANGAEETKKE